ncbi:MAG: hypothetical protein GY722_20990, partial [bacterium]|nr:hypothetical protein [bacterium]
MRLIQRLNPFHKIRELERVVAAQSDRMFRKEHASGVDMTSGRFTIEANEELTGTKKWDTLDEMENDPHIKGALQAIVGPMMNATPEIKAASEDAQDIEIAEFCAANLLRETNDNYGREVWCQSS